MPSHGRIPRTRHLFPEAAAVWIAWRRAALHSTRGIRQAVGVIPLWLMTAFTGAASLGVTCLLFFLSPAAVAVPPVVKPVVSTVPVRAPVVETPVVVPQPIFKPTVPAPAPLLLAELNWTGLPFGWNGERVEISAPLNPLQRISHQQLVAADDWKQAIDRQRPVDAFQRYFPSRNLIADVAAVQAGDVALTADSTGDLGMGLIVRKSTPVQVDPGRIFTYEISIQNASGGMLDDVQVHEKLSALDRVERVTPEAEVDGDELIWKLGPLGDRENRVLRITMNLDQRAEVLTQTRVIPRSRLAAAVAVHQPAPQVIAQPEPVPVKPPVVVPVAPPEPPKAPRLELSYTPVKSVKTGEVLSLVFTIKNVGNAMAEDVRLYVELSEEFQHRFGEHVIHQVTKMAPGESHTAQFRALVRNTGDGRLNASLVRSGANETVRELLIPVEAPGVRGSEQAGPLPSEALKPMPDFRDALAWSVRD